MKLLLRISFLGTGYNGYQVQSDVPTVQRALNEASARLFGFECDVVGCSRTDSGVHANEFFVCISEKGKGSLECTIPMQSVPVAYNSVLPTDIAVLSAREVEDSFHPRYDVKYKEYIYKILNSEVRDPFLADRAYYVPTHYSDTDVERMNAAAQHLCGTHDFSAFMASGSKIVDTHRTVMYASVEREGDTVIFKVAADGFLYNMVRIMTGTLLLVGSGRLEPSDIDAIIARGERSGAGPTAPACGLYLNKVVY